MAKKVEKFNPQAVEHLLKQLKKALTERILEGELTTKLGYEKYAISGNNSENSRNGYTPKTLEAKDGEME